MKNQYMGGLPKKGGLRKFAVLRGAWQERGETGWCFWGGLIPQYTLWVRLPNYWSGDIQGHETFLALSVDNQRVLKPPFLPINTKSKGNWAVARWNDKLYTYKSIS